MARRIAVRSFLVASLLAALVPATVAGADSAPLPASMAAVGDSISQAASSGGSLGTDYPANSWSTGTNSTVNSHFLRLRGQQPDLVAWNLSVSGAKVGGLNAQMQEAVTRQPDYLTVLIGGNDLCTDTVTAMTSVADFRASFETAMETITSGSPDTYVYVVSIPDVYQLWSLFRGDWWARFIWSVGDICQSLLANPTSTQQADVQRRAEVRQRNIDFNTQLAQVCASYDRCRWDGNASFNTAFTRSDVSGDYFHPSTAGQAKLASVSWSAGYAWTAEPPPPPENDPPTASFSASCSDLTCTFDAAASTDSDGSITGYAWSFGDGTTGSGVTTSRTYGSGGSYTVTLTVTDDDLATDSSSQSVSVSAPPPPPDGIALTIAAYKVKGVQHADLAWNGATGGSVDVYRDGARITTTANDGAYTDVIGKRGGGSYSYRICEAGTTTCSPEVAVSY